MKKAIIIILSLLLALLQVTVMPYFKIGWLNFDLSLTAVVLTALIFDKKTALINAVLCGFVMDINTAPQFGLYILIYTALVFVVRLLSKLMYKKSLVPALVTAFTVSVLAEFFVYWLFFVVKGNHSNAFALSKVIMPQALVNTLSVLVLFPLYKGIYKKINSKSRGW